MARNFPRHSFLALAAAGAGGLVLGRGALGRAQPSAGVAGPAVIRSSGGLLDLDLVAGATPGSLSPGPRLEVRPGDAVRLRFRNTLEEPSTIHYHGLHVSPGGSADNVFLSIPGGESFAYAFEIPADHPAGLFYYHPHRHGTVSDQGFGGLGGMLVVRGELDELLEVRAARGRSSR